MGVLKALFNRNQVCAFCGLPLKAGDDIVNTLGVGHKVCSKKAEADYDAWLVAKYEREQREQEDADDCINDGALIASGRGKCYS